MHTSHNPAVNNCQERRDLVMFKVQACSGKGRNLNRVAWKATTGKLIKVCDKLSTCRSGSLQPFLLHHAHVRCSARQLGQLGRRRAHAARCSRRSKASISPQQLPTATECLQVVHACWASASIRQLKHQHSFRSWNGTASTDVLSSFFQSCCSTPLQMHIMILHVPCSSRPRTRQ